jgi:hypothetical protein
MARDLAKSDRCAAKDGGERFFRIRKSIAVSVKAQLKAEENRIAAYEPPLNSLKPVLQ